MTAHNCEFVNVLQFLCSHYLERDFTWFPRILEIPGVFLNFSGSGKSKKLTLVLENREKDVEFFFVNKTVGTLSFKNDVAMESQYSFINSVTY